MAHDVFISYSTKDKPTADAVCATLEARGVRCWIAPRDILPGMDWGESIIDAIQGSQAMVLIFSGHANDSHQIKREVERAVNKNVTVVPFRIEDVPMSKSLEYFVSTPHWLDAITPPFEGHLNQLATTLLRLLARPVAEPGGAVRLSPPPPGVPPRVPTAAGSTYAPPRAVPPPARPFAPPYPAPQPFAPYGQPLPPGYPVPRQGNWPAVASLVCGLFMCVPYLTGLLAILFGAMGLRRTRDPRVGGKALAVTGVILGIGSLLLWAVFGTTWVFMVMQEQEARPAAQQFLQDVSNHNFDAAVADADGLTPRDVEALYDRHFGAWGPLRSVHWSSAVTDDRPTPSATDECAVKGEATFQNGRTKVWIVMRKQDGHWKVKEFAAE